MERELPCVAPSQSEVPQTIGVGLGADEPTGQSQASDEGVRPTTKQTATGTLSVDFYGERGPPNGGGQHRCFCFLSCCICLQPKANRRAMDSRRIDERPDRPWKDIFWNFLEWDVVMWTVGNVLVMGSWVVAAYYTRPSSMPWWERFAQFFLTTYCCDFIAYYAGAIFEHQFYYARVWHKWEHRTFTEGTLEGVMKMGFVLRLKVLLLLLFLGPILAAPHMYTGRLSDFKTTIFLAASIRESNEMFSRFLTWFVEQRPSAYYYAPTWYLNYQKFFRLHFEVHPWDFYKEAPRKGFTAAVVGGASCPFWDVCMGTSPFDIKYSLPFYLMDYFTQSTAVFETIQDPREITWTWLQRLWYASWWVWIVGTCFVAVSAYYAPWGSQCPW